MNLNLPTRQLDTWGNTEVAPGESKDVAVEVAKSYSGTTIHIPVHVKRATEPGPDRVRHGCGAWRRNQRCRGYSFVNHGHRLRTGGWGSRLVAGDQRAGFRNAIRVYLPDRRDLNRTFPGSHEGSLAARFARVVFEEIVGRCDMGIDLHTASVRRTNFPNVRGNMKDERVAELARAFGCEVIVDGEGPGGSFRAAACQAGCPTMMLEAGEVWKAEPAVIEYAVRGVKNVLRSLEMLSGEPTRPSYQSVIEKNEVGAFRRGGLSAVPCRPR